MNERLAVISAIVLGAAGVLTGMGYWTGGFAKAVAMFRPVVLRPTTPAIIANVPALILGVGCWFVAAGLVVIAVLPAYVPMVVIGVWFLVIGASLALDWRLLLPPWTRDMGPKASLARRFDIGAGLTLMVLGAIAALGALALAAT